jgi:hypothetical protein
VKKQTPTRTPADVIKDPIAGPGTIRARMKYLNTPQVQRAISIERAEKQKPIVDVPRQSAVKPKPTQRNTRNADIFGDGGIPRKR